MTTLLDPLRSALFEIEAQHEAAGWHDGKGPPPSIYWVYAPSGEPYRWHEFPVPLSVWSHTQYPSEAVNTIADWLDIKLHLTFLGSPFILRDPVVAVVFCYEFWLVFANDEEVEGVRDMAHRRELHRHPRREETRLLLCSATDGRDVYIARKRGEAKADFLDMADEGMFGDLPAAMRHLADVMKKRTGS